MITLPAIILALVIMSTSIINAQNVGINDDGSAADDSAILDVMSTSSGVLLPRMTTTQKDDITSPATGLLIYQTDGAPGFYYFDGSIWVPFDSWHGSRSQIKITPMDFQSDDRDDNLEMDQNGRYCSETGNASPVLTMAIPTGYKATHVMIYGDNSGNSITVIANEINDGSTNTPLGTGNINTEIDITDLPSTSTNYISIYINLGGGNNVYGGYIKIEPL